MSKAEVVDLRPVCPCCPHLMSQHLSEEGVCQVPDCSCILADDYVYDWEHEAGSKMGKPLRDRKSNE